MRKSELVVVPEWGKRDAGKIFKITEWPAMRAAKWGDRAFLLVTGSGERVPENVAGRGMEWVAIITINVLLQANVRYEVLGPMLDELLECVEIVRDRDHLDVATAIVSDDDIEEPRTIYWLRSEVLRVHTDFSVADGLSALISAITKSPASEST